MAILAEPVVTTFVQALLILIFVGAAIPKLRHREEFYGVVRNFRLLPERLVRPVAAVLPWFELGIATALLVPTAAPSAAGVAGAVLVVFGLAIGINVARGRTAIDCGCFRNGLKQPLSWLLVGRNGVLALAAFALAWALPLAPAASALDLAIGVAAAGLAMLLSYSAALLNGLPGGTRPVSQFSKG